MKQLRVDNLGGLGVNEDLNPFSLPPGHWTVADNVRCDRGRVRNFAGHKTVSACSGTFYYLLPVQGVSNYYWYFCSTTAIKEWNGSSCTDRTNAGGAYTGGVTDRWNGCVLHGIPVLNNGIDPPQYIASPGSGAFVDLPWDSGNSWADEGNTAKIIRSYRNFLVAMDTTESGTHNPLVFRWSGAADPGTVPYWDENDATLLAGKTTLSESSGRIVDALPLGQDLIVYQEDAIYRVSFVGAPNVLRFDPLSKTYGMRAQGCAVDIGGAHVVLSHNGVYLHNGSQITPLAYGRVAESLFADLSGDNYEQTFLCANPLEYEVWIAYPDKSSTNFPNKLLILNHKDNTWYRREIPSETSVLVPGVDLETAAEGDWTDTEAWEDDTTTWGQRSYNPTIQRIHGLAGAVFSKYDTDQQFGGIDPTCKAERTGMPLGGTNTVQTITAVYPEISGSGSVDVYIGSQDHPNDTVTWEGPYAFDPNEDVKVDCLVTGALFGIRVQSSDGSEWQLTAYTLEFAESGRR